MRVNSETVAGDDLARPRRRCARPRRAACRHWCRTARSIARPHHAPPERSSAHNRDWPCSRRRNARSRPSPRGPRASAAFTTVLDAVEIFLERAAQRDTNMIVPGLGDEDDRVRVRVKQGGEARIVVGAIARGAWSSRRPRSGRAFGASLEEFCVDGIGAGIAALDVVDARAGRASRRSGACLRAKNRRRSSARRRAASCRKDRDVLGSCSFNH